MNILVWQWGRFGSGPRLAVELAASLRLLAGVRAYLSLSDGAEILRGLGAPRCDLPVATYAGKWGLLRRLLCAPVMLAALTRRLRAMRPDVGVCVMPGPLDLLMVAALRAMGAKVVVLIHDADAHPGDFVPLLIWLQRRLAKRADALMAFSTHVAARLREQGLADVRRPVLVFRHPRLAYGAMPPAPFSHGGRPRLLFFGRLLTYKGLDMLAAALRLLPAPLAAEIRIVGEGPESPALAELRALPGVRVENRWVAEHEIAGVIAWADALVLPYKEASQSGAAAVALAGGRWVISTRVGGLVEQLSTEPLALLCEPTAIALAGALRDFLEHPPPPGTAPRSSQEEWRAFAEELAGQLRTRLGVPRHPVSGACRPPG